MVVSFMVQNLLIYNNLYMPGGLLYTADKVFFTNVALTVLIYIIDPWNIEKSIK